MGVDQSDTASLATSFPTTASSGTTNSSIVTPTPLPPTADPKGIFYNKLLEKNFTKNCTCDSCAGDLYSNFPVSCFMNSHPRDHIPVLPYDRPNILVDPWIRPYEALHLANSAIQYFSRSENEMHTEQHGALRYLRENMNILVEKLGSQDARDTLSPDDMNILCKHLLSVFYFGAPIPIEFVWAFDVCQQNNWLGFTETIFWNPGEFVRITMHPTMQTRAVEWSHSRTKSLALQRLSTLMHELIHGVLLKLCCKQCTASKNNLAAHGRAFQRLAMAIEKECLRLLELTLDLERMDSVLNDMTDPRTECNHPSMHDLEVYGFVEPLGVRMGVLESE